MSLLLRKFSKRRRTSLVSNAPLRTVISGTTPTDGGVYVEIIDAICEAGLPKLCSKFFKFGLASFS